MDFSLVNEAFREIFLSISEGIIMVDESGKIVIANPVAEQMFGYEADELQGMMLENLLPMRYRRGHLHFQSDFFANPQPRRMGLGHDLTALRKDDIEFPVEIGLSFANVQGRLVVMAFVSDISKRKQAQEALKRSEEQLIVYAAELEKKVEARTEDLNNTITRLEAEVIERKKAEEETKRSLAKERELNEMKTRFVSIASHEFRTPLSAVMSSASLIKQYKDRNEPDKLDKHVLRIKSSVNHLTEILGTFLSLDKLEEGKMDVKAEAVEVGEFLDEVAEEVQAVLKEGQTLNISLLPKKYRIYSDAGILRNIIFNLISNASKYSGEGMPIDITFSQDGGKIYFSIKDQGIGIPKEDQKYLFDRFYRASNAGLIEGTGLGLHIVKRYIELLGGEISFESEYGQGSTFVISIPRVT